MKETGKRANSLPGILAFAAGLLTCSPALLADLNSGLVAYYPFVRKTGPTEQRKRAT
jgi:hypothetical protein